MDITIFNRTNCDISTYVLFFQRIAKRTLKILEKKNSYNVSVTFVRSRTMHQINKTYRNIDRPTDVITFAFQDSESFNYDDTIDLGDIFINLDYAKKQAREYEHSLDREVCFLFTHGLLHCFGYDHMDEAEAKQMFDLQDQILDPIIKRSK